MESHPLNLAHQQQRRADAHLINNRYDEAMQCHHNAAELLLDAMKSTSSSVALESISLQHSYHLKQKHLIKSKKEQYVRVKKAMDTLKCLGRDPTLNFQGNEYSKLQIAIYRAINETDSLLKTLVNNKDNTDQALPTEIMSKGDVTDGIRTEKPREMVVEELQTLSKNLHSLIEQLVLQVEVLKDENMTLKERVNYLEKERVRYLNLPSSSDFLYRNFSTLSMESEGVVNDPVQIPEAPLTRPTNTTIKVEQPTQKTHFDLSAFKDN